MDEFINRDFSFRLVKPHLYRLQAYGRTYVHDDVRTQKLSMGIYLFTFLFSHSMLNSILAVADFPSSMAFNLHSRTPPPLATPPSLTAPSCTDPARLYHPSGFQIILISPYSFRS